MKKAEFVSRWALQVGPISTRRLKQGEGADDVRLYEVPRAGNRPVHVTLGSQVHDPVRLKAFKRFVHRIPVADICVKEAVVRLALDGSQRRQVARVRERIDI